MPVITNPLRGAPVWARVPARRGRILWTYGQLFDELHNNLQSIHATPNQLIYISHNSNGPEFAYTIRSLYEHLAPHLGVTITPITNALATDPVIDTED